MRYAALNIKDKSVICEGDDIKTVYETALKTHTNDDIIMSPVLDPSKTYIHTPHVFWK